jgi:hypothetical protein
MRVKDFAAEIIGEIADDSNFVVYSYNCTGKGAGMITFELEVEEDSEESKSYKIIHYYGHNVTLTGPNFWSEVLDLHDPKSVEEIQSFFENDELLFDNPQGHDFDSNMHHHTITNAPPAHTHTISPYIYTSGGTTTTLTTSPGFFISDSSTTTDLSKTWANVSGNVADNLCGYSIKLDAI